MLTDVLVNLKLFEHEIVGQLECSGGCPQPLSTLLCAGNGWGQPSLHRHTIRSACALQ